MDPHAQQPILLIDTSTPYGSVVLGDRSGVIRHATWTTREGHTTFLLPNIERILAGTALSQLSAIAIGIGPGSFTGLRVGLATAKGLAIGAQRRLIAISSLELLAAGASDVIATCDAFRGEIYLAHYRTGLPTPEGKITSLKPERTILKPDALIAGTGYRRYMNFFSAQKDLGRDALDPTAAIALAYAYLDQGLFADPNSLLPLYIRASEAEERVRPPS